jgi:hypothetical protein
MVKMNSSRTAGLTALLTSIMIACSLSGCTRETGIALESVEVFEKDCHPKAPLCDSKVVTTLQPNQEVEILGEINLKEGILYKIRMDDDRVGYVWLSPKFRIMKR